jgi:hypothetical protein
VVRRNNGLQHTVVERILSPNFHPVDGYPSVALYADSEPRYFRCHLLVARVFLGECPPDLECRHLDGKATDPRLRGDDGEIRLEYGTGGQNREDMRRHGTLPIGEKSGRAKLTDAAVRYILGSSLSNSALARQLGVSNGAVDRVRNGKNWKHIPRPAGLAYSLFRSAA